MGAINWSEWCSEDVARDSCNWQDNCYYNRKVDAYLPREEPLTEPSSNCFCQDVTPDDCTWMDNCYVDHKGVGKVRADPLTSFQSFCVRERMGTWP